MILSKILLDGLFIYITSLSRIRIICGLVAGESLMGLILAIPFVIKQSSDALKIVGDNFIGFSQILSVVVTLILFCYIYKISTKTE